MQYVDSSELTIYFLEAKIAACVRRTDRETGKSQHEREHADVLFLATRSID